MKITHALLITPILVSSLSAAPISKEEGFSGYVAVGASAMKYESNLVAGNALDDKMTDKKINNINDRANDDSTVQPSVNFELKYTFAEAQTEIYLGTLLEDVLTFDSTAILGVRKNFNDVGIIALAVLNSGIAAKTWEDPYQTSANRKSTDISSTGLSLKWEGIMESNFDVELRARSYDIDGGDKSGLNPLETYNGIAGSTQLNSQLDREGDLKQAILAYRWAMNKTNHLRTSIRLSDYDLDGKAMEHSRTALKFDYLHIGQKWNFVGVFTVSQDSYENSNPLYGKKADATGYGGALTALYKNPFNLSKQLSLTASVLAHKIDSDIDFYDSKISMINLGILYKF